MRHFSVQQNGGSRLLTLTSVVVLSFLMLTCIGMAQESQPDLDAYCRESFGSDAFSGVDRRDNGILCSVRTSGGLGLTHNKVDAGDICAKSAGTRRYRRTGKSIICLQDKAQIPQTINLAEHCQQAYGSGAFVTTRLTDGATMCSIRGDGGLSLQHHVIDIASLCGGNTGEVDNKTLNCTSGSAGQRRTAPIQEASPQPFPGPQPMFPPAKQNSGSSSTKFEQPVMAVACQSLGGDWRSGTLPLVEQIRRQSDSQITAGVNQLSEAPWPKDWIEQHAKGIWVQYSVNAYFQILMIWQCHGSVARAPEQHEAEDITTARDEACQIQKHLDELQGVINAKGGNMPVPLYQKTLEAWKIDNLCEDEFDEGVM